MKNELMNLPWRTGRELSDNKIPRKGKKQEFGYEVYDCLGYHLASFPYEYMAEAVVAALNKAHSNSQDPALLAVMNIKAPKASVSPERAQAAAQEKLAIQAMMANPAKKKPT